MRLLALTCLLGVLVGCGESRGPGATGNGGGGGQANAGGKSAGGKSGGGESMGGGSEPQAGAPNEGGASQAGAGGTTSSGAGGLGGGGSGGSPMVSSGGKGALSGVCEGAFGQPSPQILSGKSAPSNLSITGDELELFFNDSAGAISVYERASNGVLFPEQPTPVAELAGVCGELAVGGMDVTLDGLRLYISCSDDTAGFVGPLRLATRASRQAAFVLAPEPLGTVGNSISISQDELTLFAVSAPGRSAYTLAYQRESLDEPFGPGELVQGLGGPFSFPELSPDGFNLFGTAVVAGDVERLVVASRAQASGPFSSPTSAGLPAPAGSYLQFGPTVSQGCRLFYLNFTASVAVPSTIDLLSR